MQDMEINHQRQIKDRSKIDQRQIKVGVLNHQVMIFLAICAGMSKVSRGVYIVKALYYLHFGIM